MIYDVITLKDGEMIARKESDEGLDEGIIAKLCERPVRKYSPPKKGFFCKLRKLIFGFRYQKIIKGWEITIGELYGVNGPYIGIDFKSPKYRDLAAKNHKLFREKVDALDHVRHLESMLRALDKSKQHDDGEWSRRMFFRG